MKYEDNGLYLIYLESFALAACGQRAMRERERGQRGNVPIMIAIALGAGDAKKVGGDPSSLAMFKRRHARAMATEDS